MKQNEEEQKRPNRQEFKYERPLGADCNVTFHGPYMKVEAPYEMGKKQKPLFQPDNMEYALEALHKYYLESGEADPVISTGDLQKLTGLGAIELLFVLIDVRLDEAPGHILAYADDVYKALKGIQDSKNKSQDQEAA